MTNKNFFHKAVVKALMICIFFGNSFAEAAPVVDRRRPVTLTEKVLGDACYSFSSNTGTSPCNPAMTARDQEAKFLGQLFFGHRMSALNEAREVLSGRGDEETVNRLFSQDRPSEMSTALEASFVSSKFAISYSPLQIYFTSWLRNSSLPQISLLALQEQTLRFQLASYLEGPWSVGLQFRGVDRRYVRQDLYLTDFWVRTTEENLPVYHQSAFYLEPGILYENLDHSWKPLVSFTLVNTGWVRKEHEDFVSESELHGGFSVRPPWWGESEWGVDFRTVHQDEQWSDVARLATSYKFGILQLLGGLSRGTADLGFVVQTAELNTGLSYHHRNPSGNGFQEDQSLHFQLGFQW